MLSPVSEANERAVYVSMAEGCQAALQGYATTIEEDIRRLRDAPPGSRLQKAILVSRAPTRSYTLSHSVTESLKYTLYSLCADDVVMLECIT